MDERAYWRPTKQLLIFMRVALIAEGKTDQVVIKNILKGWLDIDGSDIRYLRPDLEYDNTDLAQMDESQFSNWTLVKQECLDGKNIRTFLEVNTNAFIVIHIDAFECDHIGYDVIRITKDNDDLSKYCEELRAKIVEKIQEWQGGNNLVQTAHAVAIEETEAWILTLYGQSDTKDTSSLNNPKSKLKQVMNSDDKLKKLFRKEIIDQFNELTTDFRKKKNLEKARLKNKSLDLFLQDLDKFKQE